MKKNLINSSLVFVLSFVIILGLQGCEKEAEKFTPSVMSENDVDVAVLKSYMSKLINVEVSEVNYDEERSMFMLLSYDQITRVELTEMYLQSLK